MEGPSLIILKEELQPFLGKKVLKVTGNTKQPKESLKSLTLESIDTWGKNLFLIFSRNRKAPIVIKTHFLMFGSYRINDPKLYRSPRLELKFKNGTVYFYSCSVRFGADEYLNTVDRGVDLMSEKWSEKHVIGLMRKKRNSFLCDLLLDQAVFAGSGNIVKNEVLFNVRRHPLTKLSHIPEKDWPLLARAVRTYCWNFYEWKKKFQLRKHWQVYRQNECPICKSKLTRKNLGKFQRKTFYCPKHEVLTVRKKKLTVYPVLPIRTPTIPEPRFEH